MLEDVEAPCIYMMGFLRKHFAAVEQYLQPDRCLIDLDHDKITGAANIP
jgi:hypothetical protein